MRYYLVTAKCGHVGHDSCIYIDFTVMANNKKEAARIIKKASRVKKNHPDCILKVQEVTKEKYFEQKEINMKDPYLNCISKYEQKQYSEIYARLQPDGYNLKRKIKRTTKKDSLAYRIKKQLILNNEALKAIALSS